MAYKKLLFSLHFHFPRETIIKKIPRKIQSARFFWFFFLVRGTNSLVDYKNSPSLNKNVDFVAFLEVIINDKNTYSSISRGMRQFQSSATLDMTTYCFFPFFEKNNIATIFAGNIVLLSGNLLKTSVLLRKKCNILIQAKT